VFPAHTPADSGTTIDQALTTYRIKQVAYSLNRFVIITRRMKVLGRNTVIIW